MGVTIRKLSCRSGSSELSRSRILSSMQRSPCVGDLCTIPACPLADGAVFAGYTIVRLLGTGGMGEVYLVQHPRLPRQEALKILPAGRERRPRSTANVSPVKPTMPPRCGIRISWGPRPGEHDGQLWITMDYVEGTDAAQLMRDRYPHGMPPNEAFEIVLASLTRSTTRTNAICCTATSSRRTFCSPTLARVIGESCSRTSESPSATNDTHGLTPTNITVGSVAYAAPEQLTGKALDGRADQYALACTAFHLLNGRTAVRQFESGSGDRQPLVDPAPSLRQCAC